MMKSRAPEETQFSAPKEASEELAAAIEAATGISHRASWAEPMDGRAVKEAFDELLMTPRPDRGLDVLVRVGVMEGVLPEVRAMVGFGEGVLHKDVWAHTKKVLLRSPRRLTVRWAALLHDIGKVKTRRFEPNGQVTFLGHPIVGARMFSRIARRLAFEPEEETRVRYLIAEHLRASAFDETWTDSAVRRFSREVGDALDDLLDLSRADITSKYAEKVRRGTRLIDTLEERVRELKALEAKPAPLPKGLGTALIDRFHLTPGPRLGHLMDRLSSDVEGGVLGVQQPFEHYIEYIEQHPELIRDIQKLG
jgi:poly(A) polymerase